MKPTDQRESNAENLEIRKIVPKIKIKIFWLYKKAYIKVSLVNWTATDFLKILGQPQNYLHRLEPVSSFSN